jgi:CDP-6-deoxy-D-xylo-4-hexulose-3-dehydrase
VNRTDRPIGVGTIAISAQARRYVAEVLETGRLSYGPFSERFERAFADRHGVGHAVLVNSGSSALHVALAALAERHGWQDGDEVVIPAVTFVATANVLLHMRLQPRLIDVDPLAYTMDPERLAAAVTPLTRAVVPVHLCGLPCDMRTITGVAADHGLRVVEDSCEATLVRVNGAPVGSHGDAAAFSTYAAHQLVTGIGGLAVTADDELALTMRSLVNHGRDTIYLKIDDGGGELATVMRRRFSFDRVGFSYRASELEAALGLAEIQTAEATLAAHQAAAAMLTERLAPLADAGLLQLPTVPPYAEHSFMMYPIVLADGLDREAVTLFLEERGIETRPLLPLLNQPAYAKVFDVNPDDLPVARRLNQQAFYVGCHRHVTTADADRVAGALAAGLGRTA